MTITSDTIDTVVRKTSTSHSTSFGTSLSAPRSAAGIRRDGGSNRVSRFNAWFFHITDRYNNLVTGRAKNRVFAGVESGTIVEIGPGVGANMAYVPAGSHLVAIEPNVAMHRQLRRRAADRAINLEIHRTGAQDIPLPDASVDEVLCSLVLCTVDDPAAVLAEVTRVLRPGGRFRFVEHVEAARWSPRRLLQRTLRRP